MNEKSFMSRAGSHIIRSMQSLQGRRNMEPPGASSPKTITTWNYLDKKVSRREVGCEKKERLVDLEYRIKVIQLELR